MVYLQNDLLKLDIDENASLYTHTRFDHAGQILQVQMKNKHSFLTTETKNSNTPSCEGAGLSGEFGIEMPIGYDDCPIGDYFPKIGVGLLQKENDLPYDFFQIYPLIKDNKQIIQDNNERLSIISSIEPHRGYGYEYKKNIILNKNQVIIAYTLKNTGTKNISTTEYCHNFIGFNKENLNGHYSLSFDIPFNKNTFTKFVNPHNCLKLEQNSIGWNATPTEDFFIENLGPIKKWELKDRLNKIAMSEEVYFDSLSCNVWGNAHVVSPEIFISIDIDPNETMEWERIYTFREI